MGVTDWAPGCVWGCLLWWGLGFSRMWVWLDLVDLNGAQKVRVPGKPGPCRLFPVAEVM